MKLNGNSLDEVLKKETLSDEDIVFLLGLTDPEDCTKLQQAAYDALGENKGAVIVMEADTGKILTLVSKPDFDPNTLAENWEILNTDEENSPLLNRATNGSYAPGSVFKIVTALAYMRQDTDYNSYSYDCQGSITEDNVTIRCFNGTVHGYEDLRSSFANSCNASFANIGLSLDVDGYRETAESLLFNKKLPSVMDYTKSSFVLDSKSGSAEIMMTAMGQGKTMVSPYHMALITETIANGGTLMQPYYVDKVTNYTGTEVKKNVPKSYKRIMTSEEAAQLKEYMAAVVSEGTGSVLSGRSYTVAGKTGTAEFSTSSKASHAWFVGYAHREDKEDIAVAVIVEDSGSGSEYAVPIAKKIFDAYYQ